jgi:alpha-D-ribose 1-methylphosphonate 5-triphosphate synthase subunit PhnH
MRVNRTLFPRGLDIILATGTMLAALPRSVHVATERC